MKKATDIMIEKINSKIFMADDEYKAFGKSDYYNTLMAKIYGMIELLEAVDGKNYAVTNVGLVERKYLKKNEER